MPSRRNLRALGLEPPSRHLGRSDVEPKMGNPADVKPGSMISVQLMAGDMGVGADGTVTYVDGSHVYAFGHRFLDIGATALPFARAEVITLLPNVNTSFKLSTAHEWMGTISQDRNTAVSGELGVRPPMVPMSFSVTRSSQIGGIVSSADGQRPAALAAAAADGGLLRHRSHRAHPGRRHLRVTGQMEFQNAPAPVRLDNLYSADNGVAAQVSLNAAIPAAYIMQSGFNSLKLKKVSINIEAFDEKRQLNIDGLTLSRHEVHAGDKLTAERAAHRRRRRRDHAQGGLPGAHRRATGAALLHGGRRQRRQSHRFPPDPARPARAARAN